MPNQKQFNPRKTLKFVLDMFEKQAQMQDSQLSLHTVPAPLNPDSIIRVMSNRSFEELPSQVIGDQGQMQLVLFNLIKNSLKHCNSKPVRLLAAFDYKA